MSFNQKNTTTKAFENKKIMQDTLLEVHKYELNDHIVIAKTDNNKLIAVKIEKAAYDRCSQGDDFKERAGHRIDKLMEADIPVGKKFVAERLSKADDGFVKIGDTNYALYEATYIINSKDFDDKVLTGIVTLCGWDGRVRTVNLWENTAFALTKGKQSEEVERIAKDMNKILADAKDGLYPTYIGFQFRAIKNDTVYELSHPMDYIPAEKDEMGNAISKSLPVSGGYFLDLCNQFYEHVEQTADRIEVCVYKSYRASEKSKYLNMVGPNKWFCLTQNKIDSYGEQVQVGKNHAIGKGIIFLTNDKVDQKSRSFIQRDMADRVFLNGMAGNVHAWVRSPGDVKVKLEPTLKIREEYVRKPKSESDELENLFSA